MLLEIYKVRFGLLGITLLSILTSCIPAEPQVLSKETIQHNKEIAGWWKGGVVTEVGIKETEIELREFTLRSDSSLALTTILEAGPRSRIWQFDTDVSCTGDSISWLAHSGYLSVDKDSMYVTKAWEGEISKWIFVRVDPSPAQLDKLISSAGNEYRYHVPIGQNGEWIGDHLKNVGIDTSGIISLMVSIGKGKYGDIHSVLICKNGKLVLEEYFGRNGELWGPGVEQVFSRKPHHMASVTKGITSLLVGIAIDKDLIESVDQQLASLLPEYASLISDGDKSQIQLCHLLTMSAGFEWDQFSYPFSNPRNDGGELYRSENVIEYIISKPMEAEPGRKFRYSNGLPVIVGEIIKEASNVELKRFAEQNLFEPLGIKDLIWTKYPDGSLETDGGLALRSRDLAKIGQLLLNRGSRDKVQVVSENWLDESTKGRYSLGRNRSYGYYWNEMTYRFKGKDEKAIFAPGDGGQFLAVFPSLDMVLVFTAGNYGTDPTETYWPIINRNILTAIMD